MSSWLDRIGLFLQFVAFIFAAPELMGHAKLLRFHQWLNRTVGLLLSVPVGFGLALILAAISFRVAGRETHNWDISFLAGGATLIALGLLYRWIGRKWLVNVLQHLEKEENARRIFLAVGAVCYLFGFIFQFVATFH